MEERSYITKELKRCEVDVKGKQRKPSGRDDLILQLSLEAKPDSKTGNAVSLQEKPNCSDA